MSDPILESGLKTIRIEEQAISALKDRIDDHFKKAVEQILAIKGRVVITGVGKSGIIAQKMVATFNSTGTPSMYLHPTDAIHGDMGMVRKEDAVIAISKSGSSEEMVYLLPLLKRIPVPIICMVGNLKSKMAEIADIVLNIHVQEEACPHDLAPTSSTTATLVMGDALAVALLEARKFTKEDFAFFHPGGALGRRLLLTVKEFMASGDELPIGTPDMPIKDIMFIITSKRLGSCLILNEKGELAGIITDGDIRRSIEKSSDFFSLKAADVMGKNPKTIQSETLASVALGKMEAFNITQLAVVDGSNRPVGIVHIHELIKAGLDG